MEDHVPVEIKFEDLPIEHQEALKRAFEDVREGRVYPLVRRSDRKKENE